jgi:tetrapyrrole methylase family protein/MazG family protein
LRRLYPADHPVLGSDGDTTVASIAPAALAQGLHLLPALGALDNVASPFGLPWLVDRLRQPDGCPWDREQDHRSLRPFLLEETYEVYDALDEGSTPELAEELGDLLLQIVLHAQFAAEAGAFDLADVQRGITTKIIRRHPHVFGDVEARTAGDVMRNWEQLKAGERAAAGGSGPGEEGSAGSEASTKRRRATDPDMPAAFAGLSTSLPALAYADEMQARAAGLGYDWPDLEGVIDKVAEEATELLAATDDTERREEFGDLLFVIVNMGRKLGIDAEAALRSASRKFASRFARVERLADAQGLQLKALGLDELDDLWQEAKRDERRDGESSGREAR